MSDEEFIEEEDADVEEVDDLDEVIDDDLDELAVVDPELDIVEDDELADDSEEIAAPAATGRAKRRLNAADDEDDPDDDSLDLEEELHPDDVEDPLDVMLKERTAAAGMAEEEEDIEDETEPEERGATSTKIVPRRANEFLCSSCFLVLPLHQLADKKRKLCTDCV